MISSRIGHGACSIELDSQSLTDLHDCTAAVVDVGLIGQGSTHEKPAEYRDLEIVFSKESADRLPEVTRSL